VSEATADDRCRSVLIGLRPGTGRRTDPRGGMRLARGLRDCADLCHAARGRAPQAAARSAVSMIVESARRCGRAIP
jgi:hypothetical protein